METNGTDVQAYTNVVMNKALLDWEMQCLETKIKCKNEENSKLENQISERRSELEKLKKSASTACEREEQVKNNINMLRNSRAITEGLLMSIKHQLLVQEEKRMETKKIRTNIIEKYSTLFESHSKVYSSLPWVQRTTEVKISIEQRKIQLHILKFEYSSFKNKIATFNRIQGQRIVVAITKLARDIVARNNLRKEVHSLSQQQKALETQLTQLKEVKVKLQEKVELKVKEAVEEARVRVVKAHVDGSSGEKLVNSISATKNLVIPSISNQLKPVSESIFSRLGLSAPHGLKRSPTITPGVLKKVPRLVEEPKKAEVLMREKIYNIYNNVTSSVENEKVSTIEKKTVGTENHNSGMAEVQEASTGDVNKSSNLPVGKPSEDKIISNNIGNKKKKLKKKVNKNSKMETSSHIEQEKRQTSSTQKNTDAVPVAESLKGKCSEPSSEQMIGGAAIETLAETVQVSSQDVMRPTLVVYEKAASPIKEVIIPIEPDDHCATILNDPDMNNSNLSAIDNISVVSSTFETNENRNQMDRSPDFLAQTPQGYFFSPVFSPSKTDVSEVSSLAKDQYEFASTPSALSSHFDMETQKVPEGPPSDFTSFFGTSSPKKIEKTSKNFFQLFG